MSQRLVFDSFWYSTMGINYVQDHILNRRNVMPYPKGHRDRMREQIIESARRLFNRNGFENVSIDAIMAHAGLTHGAFYSYFQSKSDLYVEALRCFFTDPNWKNRWRGVKFNSNSRFMAPQIVRAYLSHQHYDDVENSCPMVALPCDVARSSPAVKSAFESVFKAMVAALEREVVGAPRERRDAAMAIATLCIGGMVVARSLNDAQLAAFLRAAATDAALSLGGWNRKRSRRKSLH
jgi:TetR/AcrR family transcriptional regulator, transcriptional repressor for nem operon